MSLQEKSLIDLLRDMWQARVMVLTFAAIGVLCAAVWMMMSTPYYKAQMIVSPANPMNGAEVSSLLANDNLFALRYLVQRVGVSNTSDFLRFENIYKGPSVAAELMENDYIMLGVAEDRPFVFSAGEDIEMAENLAGYIQDNVAIQPVGATSMRRLVYHHPDRNFGRFFLAEIHRATDTKIRSNIREEAGERIEYLGGAIRGSKNPEHRRVLTTMLLEQERLRMLASLDQPYTAAVVEPSSSSAKPVKPDPYMIFPGFLLLGAVLGFIIFGLQQAGKAPKAKPQNARQWFKTDSANEQRKVLTDKQDAA